VGVAAGTDATLGAVSDGAVAVSGGAVALAVFAGAAMRAGWRVGAACCGTSKAASGSTESIAAAIGSTRGVAVFGNATVFAEVSGRDMGLSCPTGPAEDAVPSRPVLATIVPTPAESVREMAPAAASADLRFMVTSVFARGVQVGFKELGT
jgi:hypothetical protein